MASLSDIRKSHREAGAMHSLLAPATFIGENAVLTKSGDVFVTLRLTGKDPECMEEGEIADVTQRFAAALRTLGPEYRVYQYLVKQHSPDIAEDPAADMVQRRRLEFLAGRARDLYSVRLYLVILRSRPIVDATRSTNLLRRFSLRNELRVANSDLRRQVDGLRATTSSVIVQLKDTLDPILLGRSEILGFLARAN